MFRTSLQAKMIGLMGLALVAGFTASAVRANDAPPTLAELFQKGQTTALIQNVRSLAEDARMVDDAQRGPVLRLTYNNEYYADLRPQPVTPGQAYELTYDYRWDNTTTLETNPSLEAAHQHGRAIPQIEVLPAVMVVFLDEKRQQLQESVSGYLLHGQWRPGRYAFIAPAGATHAMVRFRAGRDRGALLLSKLALNPLPQVMTPQGIRLDFRQPSLEQTGRLWGSCLLDGQVRQTPEGALAVYVPSRDVGRFPLPGPGAYRLKAVGHPQAKISRVVLTFLDDQGKAIRGQSVSAALDAVRDGLAFTPPAEAQSVQINIRETWLESVEILRAE